MAAGSSGSSVFEWGNRVAGSDQSYESMCYKGTWYSLHDCVFVRSDAADPYVGKLMRLFEEGGVRQIRIRWFLRASELPISATKELPGKNKKELFIAQGSMKGVENVNVVEVILGKAIVLCTAKCSRNPQPTQLHVDGAHYFFNKAYDVLNKKLVKVERVDQFLAQKFFNKPEWLSVVENAPWEDTRSPTSVRDFEMVSKKRPLSDTPSMGPGGTCVKGNFHGATEFKKFKGGL